MRIRALLALLLLLPACATTTPSSKASVVRSLRLANLQRASALPWRDEGRCVVREASEPWAVLAERCFHALDHDRIRFNDPTRRCAVASADAAALGLGLCVLAAPEIVVGAVIVVGVVAVGVVIKEALEAYELRGSSSEEVEHSPQIEIEPASQDPSANRKPKPEPAGQDGFPPVPTEPLDRERSPECRPVPVPHAGEDDSHNECADKVPPNRYPRMDVLVGGGSFDALQVGVRVLWEIKTHRFDTYPDFVQEREIAKEMKQLRKQRDAARDCGYDFVVGVSTEEHEAALLREDPLLKIVVTGCKR